MRRLLGPAGRSALRRLAAGRALVALDFDGTLAPIVDARQAAAPRPETLALLRRVAERYPTVILTGRARRDAARRLPGVALREVIGNHGAEGPRAGPGGRRWRAQARRWAASLRAAARGLPGVEVEDKGLTVTAHYRHADDPARARRRLVAAARALPGARVMGGKRVVTALPADAPHKGHALAEAARRLGAAAVLFVGDDDTDEEAFGHPLGVPAVTARVGPARTTLAGWRLGAQSEVDDLLALLITLRPEVPMPGPTVERVSRIDPGELPEVLSFLRVLWELDHALNARSKRMQAEQGITGPQRLLLRAVGLHPGASPADMARLLHLHPASVTRLAAGLVRRGLVARARHPSDSRRLQLRLTPRGQRVDGARRGTVEACVQGVLARRQELQITVVQEVLAELAQSLMPAGRRR